MARRWRDGWARYDGGAKPTRAPRTLAVIVAMEEDACGLETCVRRVSEIVEWCSRRGVERTSVYDGTGRMRDGAGRQALERALQKRSEEEAFEYVLRACDETQGGAIREVGRGGRAGGRRTVEVDALGGRDACAALVDAARRADLDDDSEESEDESESGGKRFAYKDKVRELERWMRDEGTFLPPADVVVVGVCDLDTQRIERVIKSFRAQDTAKGYQDYRKLLERKDIDGSDINDDGIEHRLGRELKLQGRYETLENGSVRVYAKLA